MKKNLSNRENQEHENEVSTSSHKTYRFLSSQQQKHKKLALRTAENVIIIQFIHISGANKVGNRAVVLSPQQLAFFRRRYYKKVQLFRTGSAPVKRYGCME